MLRRHFQAGVSQQRRVATGRFSTAAASTTTAARACSSSSPPADEGPTGALRMDVAALSEQLASLQAQHNDLLQHIVSTQQAAAAGVPASAVAESFVPPAVLRTVVKIFAGVAAPNHILPWQRKLQTNISGTGFVVDKKRRLIATNTHVIGKATSIQVRRHGAGHRHVAETVFIAADCDFALVRVDDDAFWRDVEEAQFDGLTEAHRQQGGLAALCSLGPSDAIPDLQASVKVIGFPWGGDQVSITSGVVSRVDMTNYGGTDSSLLGIQIDAAINSGNSGGPALVDSKVIGIAFQTLVSASNIGYLIPACVAAVAARAFVNALAQHHAHDSGVDTHVARVMYHQGFSSVGIGYQDLTNDTLRRVHGLVAPEQTGCLVEHVFKRCSADGTLRVGDVITRVNGMDIADDGTVQWKPDQRVSFSHFVRCTLPGATFALDILRDGVAQSIDVTAKPPFAIIPNHTYSDRYLEVLPYRVFAGCVFTELTMGYLLEWGDPDWFNNAPRHLTSMLFPRHSEEAATGKGGTGAEGDSASSSAPEARDSIVILSQILPHAVNRGYASEQLTNRYVDRVNGTVVRSFEHFNELLDAATAAAPKTTAKSSGSSPSAADVTLLLSNGSMNMSMALDAAPAAEADTLVAEAYGIPALVRFPGGMAAARRQAEAEAAKAKEL